MARYDKTAIINSCSFNLVDNKGKVPQLTMYKTSPASLISGMAAVDSANGYSADAVTKATAARNTRYTVVMGPKALTITENGDLDANPFEGHDVPYTHYSFFTKLLAGNMTFSQFCATIGTRFAGFTQWITNTTDAPDDRLGPNYPSMFVRALGVEDLVSSYYYGELNNTATSGSGDR